VRARLAGFRALDPIRGAATAQARRPGARTAAAHAAEIATDLETGVAELA
jgi:hypothetical protein